MQRSRRHDDRRAGDGRYALRCRILGQADGGNGRCSSSCGRSSRAGRSGGGARAGAARRRLGRARHRARPARQSFSGAAARGARVLGLRGRRRTTCCRAWRRRSPRENRRPTFWSYTNAGWCLLGRALETLTGRNWEDAMHGSLLAPLGWIRRPSRPGRPRAPRLGLHDHGRRPVPVEPWRSRALGPAGGTTALDGRRPGAVREARTRGSVPRGPAGCPREVRIHGWLDAWCLGWARFDWDGGPVWGWDGLIEGQRAILRLLPEHRGAVVLLTNGSTGRALYRSLFADPDAGAGSASACRRCGWSRTAAPPATSDLPACTPGRTALGGDAATDDGLVIQSEAGRSRRCRWMTATSSSKPKTPTTPPSPSAGSMQWPSRRPLPDAVGVAARVSADPTNQSFSLRA